MLSSVEQAFVGREEIRAPLKTPAWEANRRSVVDLFFFDFTTTIKLVTNFPYLFTGSVSEDYRKERLPSTSVGSLHHSERR